MIGVIISVFLGAASAIVMSVTLSQTTMVYMSAVFAAALYSLMGALDSCVKNKFSITDFLSDILLSTLFSVFIIYIGKLIGTDTYNATIILFAVGIFVKISNIRKTLITNLHLKSKNKQN